MWRFLLVALLAGCVTDPDPSDITIVEDPPPEPVILLLAGEGRSAEDTAARWGVDGAITLAPDGRWNASVAYGTGDDRDDTYSIIAQLAAYGVGSTNRAIIMGEGNGAFMAWRIACERPMLVKAIVMLNGAANAEGDAPCSTLVPFSTLDIHGTVDDVISYAGGRLDGMAADYPSVAESVAQEKARSRCEDADHLDSYIENPDLGLPDDRVLASRCMWHGVGMAEQWTIIGWDHNPVLPANWGTLMRAWALQAIGR